MFRVFALLLICLCSSALSAQSWQKCTLPSGFNVAGTSPTYLDVFFQPSNPQNGWVCGYGGRVLRTTDGGNNWQGALVPFNGRSGGHLESVHFPTSQVGYCSGPCGVFKSVNGGASWVDLTQNLPDSTIIWGLYFLNADHGVMVGGGCSSFQGFYLTTNGGATWSRYSLNVASSGLTDVILYPSGLGIAVGSGSLYKSLDSGRTWTQWQSRFQAIWDEELTISGSSICVPYAGSDCAGGGPSGGVRFSSDSGQSWVSFNITTPFYGAYLVNPATAWACGSARNVWRTTNSGANWEIKNCGVDGDLDDVWFIDDTTGFVVGNAVYRYSGQTRTLSKNSIDFGTMCFPGTKYDTLWVRNRSFNGASAAWSLSGSDVQHFSVLQPNTNFGIASCDSTMIVVRFQPRTAGSKNIGLTVTFSDGSTLTASVSASSGGVSTVPADTLVTMASVQCGTPIRMSVGFNNSGSQTDQIIQLNKLSGTAFTPEVNPPIIIPPGGGVVGFNVMLPDTGWQTGRYQFRVGPCIHDTIITLRAYGVSAIVNTPAQLSFISECLATQYDSVAVTNTGNADLIISNNYIASGSSEFSIVGWTTGELLPVTIKKNQTKYLRIRFSPKNSGVTGAVLRFSTNDFTTTRGNKTLVDVILNGKSSGVSESISAQQLDFGQVCPGQYPVKTLRLSNTGSADFTVQLSSPLSAAFQLNASKTLPAVLKPGDTLNFVVQFLSDTEGKYIDSLVLGFQPCDSARLVIPISAERVATKLSITPLSIDTLVRTSTPSVLVFDVTNTGSGDAVIDAIALTPARTDWTIISQPGLPLRLSPGQKTQIRVELKPQGETEYQGTLTVSASAICSTSVNASIHAIASETLTSISKTRMFFPVQRCAPVAVFDTLTIANAGASADTLFVAEIRPSGTMVFQIVSAPPLPALINKNAPVQIIVRSLQSGQGVDSASLVLRFANSFQATEVFLPLRAEQLSTATTAADTLIDFGVHEPCDGLQRATLRFSNAGNLDDELRFSFASHDPTLKLATPSLRIAANANGTVDLLFDPSLQFERIVRDTVIVQSIVCAKTMRIAVSAVIHDPRLTVSPSSLSFGQLWKHDKQTRWLSIVNHSTAMRRVVSIRSTNDAHAQLSFPGQQPPFTLQVGDSIGVQVDFTADSAGSWSSELIVVEQSSCADTTLIAWSALVPREMYRAHLSVDRNILVRVGEYIDFHVYLSTNDTAREALYRAEPSSLEFGLEYNDETMNVIQIQALNSTLSAALPFTKTPGKVSFSIPSNVVRQLGASDTLLRVRAQGMKNIPSQTRIHPVEPKATVSAGKEVEITTEDGDFAVQGCMLWVSIAYREVLSAQLATQPADDHLTVLVRSSASSEFDVELHSLIGQVVHQEHCAVSLYNGELRIDTKSIASGEYVLRIRNAANQEQTMLVIIQH